MPGIQVRDDIIFLQVLIANVCLVGTPHQEGWVLVDAGLKTTGQKILDTALEYYGEIPPAAIVLTHGHFDHVGALEALLDQWQVPVYAHPLELPYLTGKKDYPPADPSVSDGLMAKVSPLYPNKAINLSDRVKPLPDGGIMGFLHGWRYLHTPGHTPGHISLFRDGDKTLIAGDAFLTVNQESALDVISQEKEVNGPPAYFTTDWEEAKTSVRKLAGLNPQLVIAGHGQPLGGEKLKSELNRLANNFDELAVPDQGRYVSP